MLGEAQVRAWLEQSGCTSLDPLLITPQTPFLYVLDDKIMSVLRMKGLPCSDFAHILGAESAEPKTTQVKLSGLGPRAYFDIRGEGIGRQRTSEGKGEFFVRPYNVFAFPEGFIEQ